VAGKKEISIGWWRGVAILKYLHDRFTNS